MMVGYVHGHPTGDTKTYRCTISLLKLNF